MPYLHKFNHWRKSKVSDTFFLFVLVVVVGLLCGVGAFILKKSIGFVARTLTEGLHPFSANWALILIPIAGVLITGILCRYVFKDNLEHGVRQMINSLHEHRYKESPWRMISYIITSVFTLGMGGSAGSEGPIASTGGAIGSNMARWFGMSPRMAMLMIGCGAGAGIAGIFKAPLGGALFTLEVMRIPMSTIPVLALITCTMVAGMTAYALGGFTVDIPTTQSIDLFDYDLIGFVFALGLVSGIYSLYYSYIMKKVEIWLGYLKNPWVKNIISGAFIGLVLYVFPSLYGEGYNVVGALLDNHTGDIVADSPFVGLSGGAELLIFISLGVVLIKCFVTSATNSGGGVAGDFAPVLFVGGVLGFLFVMVLNTYMGEHLPIAPFVLLGMAGVMAGAIRAPLMAIMLTTEMVGSYGMFLPILIISATSFGIVRLFTADNYFAHQLDRANGWLHHLLNK